MLDRPAVLATSAPAAAPDLLANLLVEGGEAAATVCPRETVHARGTGDFFAAIFLAHRLNGLSNRAALQAATAAMRIVLEASKARAELALIETQAAWAQTPPPLAQLAVAAGFHDAGWIAVQRARRLDRLHNAFVSCVRPVKRRAPPECGRSSRG